MTVPEYLMHTVRKKLAELSETLQVIRDTDCAPESRIALDDARHKVSQAAQDVRRAQEILPGAPVLAQPRVDPEGQADILLKRACWLGTGETIYRYLMANAHGRWDGAEKAMRHHELCLFYTRLRLGVEHDPAAGEQLCEVIRNASRALTDRLDEAIGFPLNAQPDYDKLAPLFFERFHAHAMTAGINTTATTSGDN